MSTIYRISSICLLSVLVLGVIFIAAPAGSVFAQSPIVDTPPPPAGNPADEDGGAFRQAALEKLYKRAVANHERQSKMIEQADNIGNRIAEMIARAKENGKDTTALETALAEFNESLGEARLKFDQTDRIIQQHPGFDDEGKVVEAETARNTLEEIRTGSK
jgi:hypothetical protein